MGNRKVKPNYRRIVLRLPDLDHSKMAVLNSLTSASSRRVYEYAIKQFIDWYCSEPRLAFNRIVVVRYRMHLESRRLAANTINQQLAAVRRLAHEAADAVGFHHRSAADWHFSVRSRRKARCYSVDVNSHRVRKTSCGTVFTHPEGSTQ